MNTRPWTEEEFQRAFGLHVAGWSMAEIASAVGRTEAATRFKFIANGYSSRRIDGPVEKNEDVVPLDRSTEDGARADAERLIEEREKRAAQRRERDEAVRSVLEDRLVETFRESVNACNLSMSICPPVPSETVVKAGAAVLLLGDIHFGKVVAAREIEQESAYNPAVSIARLALLEAEVLHHLRNGPPVDELVVLLLGDIVEGALDHGAEREETLLLAKQFSLAASILSQFIAHLASAVPHVRVHGVSGNHGRWPQQRRMPSTGRESNMDRLVYTAMELITKAAGLRSVKFDLRDSSRQLIDVKGLRIQIAHGDQMRGGDFCIGGLKREVVSSVLRHGALGNTPDLWIIGDKHQSVSIPVGRGGCIINGSLVGEDAYGQRYAPAPPSQTLFWICPERRKRTLQAEIRLDDATPPDPLPYELSTELVQILEPFLSR